MPFMFDPCRPCCKPQNYLTFSCCGLLSGATVVLRNPKTNAIILEEAVPADGRLLLGERSDKQYLVQITTSYGVGHTVVDMLDTYTTEGRILQATAVFKTIGPRLCCGIKDGIIIQDYNIAWNIQKNSGTNYNTIPLSPSMMADGSYNSTLAYTTIGGVDLWTTPWVEVNKDASFGSWRTDFQGTWRLSNIWMRWGVRCNQCDLRVLRGIYYQIDYGVPPIPPASITYGTPLQNSNLFNLTDIGLTDPYQSQVQEALSHYVLDPQDSNVVLETWKYCVQYSGRVIIDRQSYAPLHIIGSLSSKAISSDPVMFNGYSAIQTGTPIWCGGLTHTTLGTSMDFNIS